MSVLQFAVELLKVKHVIACGHCGCGAIAAALADSSLGLIDNWLRKVRNVLRAYARELAAIEKLGVHRPALRAQRRGTGREPVRQDDRARGLGPGPGAVFHGWIYALRVGLLLDLGVCVRTAAEADAIRERSVSASTR